MAFQDVGSAGAKFKKLTELKVGESITGYVTGTSESSRLPGAVNLNMNIEGEVYSVSVAGNVKYMIKDGKIANGLLTRITRQEDTKIKGKTATKFKVEQDPTSVLAGFQATSTTTTPAKSMTDKLASLKG